MSNINILAVVVAALASFVGSAVWYMVFGKAMARLQGEWRGATEPEETQAWQVLGFLATAVVLAFAVAFIFALAGVSGWASSVGLGLVLWVGFCATQWVGSILGEQVPLRLAAIHGGDWLAHVLIISSIVGVWT